MIFNEPVYKNATPNAAKVTPEPAQLVLRTKCQVRDAETLTLSRHIRERSTDSSLGTQTQFIRRDELTVTHVPTYSAATYAEVPTAGADPRVVDDVESTVDDVNAACDYYIDAALEEYQQPEPRQVRTAGIYPIDLDGAIAQVTYQIGPSGATTTVARGSEPSSFAASHGERRRAELSREANREVRRRRSGTTGRTTRREAAARRQAR